MEQKVDLEIDGKPEDIKEVMDFLNVDKTQRSDNNNNLFDVFEFPKSEHSLVTGYTDTELDPELDRLYALPENENHIFFKSFRKNLFKTGQFLSEKFPACRFKISWMEKIEGEEQLYVFVIEKSCIIYYQRGIAYTIAPNYREFIRENNLEKFVENHTRIEQESL